MSTGLFHAAGTLENEKSYSFDTENWLDLDQDTIGEVQRASRELGSDACEKGLSSTGCEKMKIFLAKYRNIFGFRLRKTPCALFVPLTTNLRKNIKLVITRPRRFSALQKEFIATYVGKLDE